MGLVDYPSSSEGEAPQPPSKRRKGQNDASESEMPPLPTTFHDLYASTVRQSIVDDPSLHQGRKRLNPHVAGNWPTHLYVEWHPTKSQHDILEALVIKAQQELGDDTKLHNFLTSDLGTDLPLHISLSRPLSLSTSIKDDYLSRVEHIIRNCGTGVFSVKPEALAWYKSPDSNRTFFVLRVVSTKAVKTSSDKSLLKLSTNPELMTLLTRCNKVATHFGQPPLYQQTQSEAADEAFHISIGWTMGAPDEETCLKVLKFFRVGEFKDIRTWNLAVDGVKVKIGNIVSHLPLVGKDKAMTDGAGSIDSLYSV